MAVGAGLAVLAAVAFGVTTPIIERAGRGVGALSTAAFLYAGACLSAFALGVFFPVPGAPFRRAELRRLAIIAFVGAGVAPTLLAWGLQREGAMTGSLLLNLEAVFTVALAWALYREPIGRRVRVAVVLMSLGGVTLALDSVSAGGFSGLGALAIVGATAGWALDNALSRSLADRDPVKVVAGKGAMGALLTGTTAFVLDEPFPRFGAAVTLLLCGATGYGLSLRLYLLAQRRIGAARTGSIFAVAPFIGAALAWALGDETRGARTIASAVLFGAGVALHVTERHRHVHTHFALEHEHAHRHDDGHHGHWHDPPVIGEHSHPHRHEHVEHEHEHAPDVHHEHEHG